MPSGRVRAAHSHETGFTLVEVLIAAGVLAVALAALAHLLAGAVRASVDTRRDGYAAILAAQKLEELESLTMSVDAAGRRWTDLGTDTSTTPALPMGGTGLTPSPSDSHDVSTPGYVDHVDASGRKMGGGTIAPAGAAFTRRWSITPLEADPGDSLVIQVSVLRAGTGSTAVAGPEGARLITIRTRTR